MRAALQSGVLGILMAAGASMAQTAAPALSFSGYVDADFATKFLGGGLKDPAHTTGLEIDLTTTVTFSPKVNAVIYTTMNDGAVPAQGAGNTWDGVNFDGATLNWLYNDKTTIFVGDIIYGTGYFNYYLNKRSAIVVGEHAVRGVGFTRDGWTVSTGATGLGAMDSTGPIPTSQWATFVKYDYALGNGRTLTPSAKYTAGIPGATPFTGGLSFDGPIGKVSLSADAAVNYYSSDYKPGYTFLIEPMYTSGKYSVASAVFVNVKGEHNDTAVYAPNTPSQTITGTLFDDLFVYVEPGYALSDRYAFGLPIEYHDANGPAAVAQGYDQSVWVVPTLYVYPGAGVQWWIWAQVVAPVSGTGSQDPQYFAGSEIIFKF
jgi:hypothetical protein